MADNFFMVKNIWSLIFAGTAILIFSSCSSPPERHFIPSQISKTNPELQKYLFKMSDEIYPLWKKILVKNYAKELATVQQRQQTLSTKLSFKILKDGTIENLKISSNSQERFANFAAWEAFREAGHFPAPPAKISSELAKGSVWEMKITP